MGKDVGANVGANDGASEGVSVGDDVGARLGEALGSRVGLSVGNSEGNDVGFRVGTIDGMSDDSVYCRRVVIGSGSLLCTALGHRAASRAMPAKRSTAYHLYRRSKLAEQERE